MDQLLPCKFYGRDMQVIYLFIVFIYLFITIRRDARQNPIVQIMQLNWREALKKKKKKKEKNSKRKQKCNQKQQKRTEKTSKTTG